MNISRYNILCHTARRYLSAPPTSVPSERIFSTASDTFSETRSCLNADNMERLVFLKANAAFMSELVCKVWRDEAKREKERRQYFKWNCFLVEHASSVGGDNKSWWQSVANFFLESPIEPKCLLMFCSHSLWTMLTEAKPQGEEENKAEISAAELFGPYLPKDCTFNVILTDGIIGTDANMKTLELNREESDEALSLIMFGETSGVKFVPFSLTRQDCVSLIEYWPDYNGRIPQCVQPLHNEIKMINVYLPKNGTDLDIDPFYRMFNWPLVTGAFVNEQHVRDSHGNFFSSALNTSCVMSGLAICGANVKVASVLIESQDIADVDRTVQDLTEHKFPLHRSFGLMYSWVGRGSHVYGKQNVESSIFRKYFPTTPLLGCFGNVEVFVGEARPFLDDAEMQSKIQSAGKKISSLGNLSTRASQMELMSQLKHLPTFCWGNGTVMCLVSLS